MKNFFVVLLLSAFCLTGCFGDRCIEADDFGFLKFVISSRYDSKDLTSKQEGNQVAPWIDSEYRVNGQPLTIVVKTWDYKNGASQGDRNNAGELSAWGPWYGQQNNFHTLSDFCVRLPECNFVDGVMCTPARKDANLTNAPCLFKNGVGLYLLIAERDTNPNLSPESQRIPSGIVAHLGDSITDYNLYDLTKRGELVRAGGINYQYEGSDNTRASYSQCPLYFKIVDKFYEDNNGQYRVVIKSGVTNLNGDPLEFLTTLITEELFGSRKKYVELYENGKKQPELTKKGKKPGIVQSIYENIIATPGYRVAVNALLTIAVIITGFSFITGNVNFTHTELIIRILKLTVVSTLLSSTNGWQFFNDNLFVYFVDGVQEILRIIKETGNTGPGSSNIIALMIAPQTMAKLFSLLFVDKLGFIYILLYLIALYFIFILVFKATIIYLTALITIGMIITMAPIFICFMLFNITRSLFENWLKQLISYAIQPIILFTGLVFISMIVRTEIYSTLGFAVCKYDFPDLGPITQLFSNPSDDLDPSIEGSIFYWWFPSPMKGEKFTKTRANILVPVDHTVENGTPDGKLCLAYECIENRYIELPFLNPVTDITRINNFFNGTFFQLDGLLLIFVCVYLLSKFNDIAISTARFLTSTSGNITNLQTMEQAAYMPIQRQLNRPVNYVTGSVKKWASRKIDPIIYQYFAKPYEDWRMGSLDKEALNPASAKPSILNEIKRNYGINYGEVDHAAIEKYHSAIAALLQKDGIKDKVTDLGQTVHDLSLQNYKDLVDSIGHLKYDNYDPKNASQQAELNELMKMADGKSLRELASDAKYTRDYLKAYKEVHQQMSARGVGLFGKNISPLQNWQEMNRRIKDKEALRNEKRRNRGEKIYAAYTGLKRAALTAVVGKDLRDVFEGNLTSAEWHDFDYNDPRLRTYSEALKDQQRELEHRELNNKINKETINAQADISSPEYLARLEQQGKIYDIEYCERLTSKKLTFDIYDALASNMDKNGEPDPVLMGDRFMREKATDSQTRNMIDSAYEIEDRLIKNDRYIGRKPRYEIMKDKADENIRQKKQLLEEHYNKDNIAYEELPALLNQYYHSMDPASQPADIDKEVNALVTSINNLDYSQKVMKNIERREEFIKEVVSSHVRDINKYRLDARMAAYDRERSRS